VVSSGLTLNTITTGNVATDSVLLRDGSGIVKEVSPLSVGIITANNGLSVNGNNFVLGGTLTGTTTICLSGNSLFFNDTESIYCFTNNGLNFIAGNSCNGPNFIMNSTIDTIFIDSFNGAYIDIYGSGNCITLGNTLSGVALCGNAGFVYDDNYSANFIDESLITKRYVTSQISGITTNAVTGATNGLTKTGSTISFGGLLNTTTTILGANNDLCLGTSTCGLNSFYVESNESIMSSTSCTLISSNTQIDVCSSGSSGIQICSSGDVNLTGTVKFQTTPNTGTTSDSVIVWNSDDYELKIVDSNLFGENNNIYTMSVVTGDTILTTGSTYVQLINSPTTGVTITLPPTPINGLAFKLKDVGNAAFTYNITISRNGNLINGTANDANINTNSGGLELAYNVELGSWFIISFVN
jgi:hypothetical protein